MEEAFGNDTDVIKDNWLTTLCDGEDPFDIQRALNSSTPYLNHCQKDILLTWPIALFLFFGTIGQIYVLAFTPGRGQIKWTWYLILKYICNFLLFGIASASLGIHITRLVNQEETALVSDLASILFWLCVLDLLLLTEVNRRKGRRSSSVVWLGWFILVVCGVLPFIQVIIDHNGNKSEYEYYQNILFLCSYPLIILELILNTFADVYKYDQVSEEKECPESGSSFLSRITCFWFTRTAILGYKRALTRDDIWNLRLRDSAAEVVPRFEKYWNKGWEKQKHKMAGPKASTTQDSITLTRLDGWSDQREPEYKSIKHPQCPSIVMTLVKTVKWDLLPATILRFTGDLMTFANPQILKFLLTFIATPSMPMWIGILLALLMFGCSTVQAVIQQQSFYRMFNVAMNVRTALTSRIYKKALRLSTTARKDATVGEMVNLMAVDVQRMSDVTQWIQVLWSTPVVIAIGLYSLYVELGYSALFGFAVMLLILPINYLLAQYQRKKQIKMLALKDKRMKLMNEILNGMKVLKLYAWEEPFEKKVLDVRNDELQTLKRSSYFEAINIFTITCAPFLIAVVSFAAFVLSSPENILTPQKAFVSLSLFNILRMPLFTLPSMISAVVQANVSNKRLRKFLSHPELNPDLVVKNGKQEESVLIHNGTFAWSDSDENATLNDINLAIKPGQMVAVVGPVGCGKSSLLSAILGDMEPRGGVVYVKGSMAYVPQQAWIQSLPLRKNIIFAKAYLEQTYNRAVEACALKPDFDMLPDGDTTEIGEKGINLSGGQKQRVSLARAVYQDRDVYLLDDPLSAVDAHVGRHIFNEVIGNDGLLKGKTRILVTHSLAYLKHMDNIFVMKDGKITQNGTLPELVKQGGAFAEFLEIFMTQRSHDPTLGHEDDLVMNEIVEELEKVDPGAVQRLHSRSATSQESRKNSIRSSQGAEESTLPLKTEHGESEKEKKTKMDQMKDGMAHNQTDKKMPGGRGERKLGEDIKHENVKKGKIQWRIYKAYLSAVGYLSFVALISTYIVTSGLSVGTNIWLSEWSEDSNHPANQSMGVDIRLGVYASFGILQGLFVFLATFIGIRVMLAASVKLHHQLLHALLRVPMSFYDVTPLGTIVSRVGKDVDIMDVALPMLFRMWISQALSVVSSILVIVISTPIVGVAIVPLGLLYYFLQKFYVSTARQLRRLESASRAPIYSHFGETLSGATSIRGYAVEGHFINEAEFRLDSNMKLVFASLVASRWLGILLQILGNLLVMFAALFAVLARDSGIAAGVVGLSITYASSITMTLQMSVRLSSELEANVVAVERIKEYADMTKEAPWITEIRPPKNWPSEGKVDFEQLELRYRDGQDLVLKGLDWHIDEKEKVGVVGRTGAGKSSMTLALFRIVEAAAGRITIDNIDISKIGLHDLRSRLGIIPQDPILFSGTLRINLDPFDEHQDDALWNALEQAHLKTFVAQLPDGLQYKVAEGGENLSVGQRQLLCLARALLRRSKILVLDEATSAVDMETERLILETIRNGFHDCSIITIAHRLNTILDSDKILVMSQGRSLEHGPPDQLLSDRNSVFFGMANDTGLVSTHQRL